MADGAGLLRSYGSIVYSSTVTEGEPNPAATSGRACYLQIYDLVFEF